MHSVAHSTFPDLRPQTRYHQPLDTPWKIAPDRFRALLSPQNPGAKFDSRERNLAPGSQISLRDPNFILSAVLSDPEHSLTHSGTSKHL